MTSILLFIAVLSVLVFVHELGHFLAAKACNIYVDRFSIGMPPRLAGFKWGETDYCIGGLPLGGYVKMAGQEDAPLSEEERDETYGHVPPHRWFNKKPVWQRVIVLLAGPTMNFVLAVAIYALLAYHGAEVTQSEVEARIGKIAPKSPAASAPLYKYIEGRAWDDYKGTPDATGWKTGDLIASLDGHTPRSFGDFAVDAVIGGAKRIHHIVIEREMSDGSKQRYASLLAPKLLEGEDHARFGVGPFDAPVVRGVMPDMAGKGADLKEGDEFLRANGERVSLDTFVETIENQPKGASIDLEVLRGTERLHKTLTPTTLGRFRHMVYEAEGARSQADFATAIPAVAFVEPDYAKQTGIKRRDRIVEVNGKPATFESLQKAESSSPDGKLEVKIDRPPILFGLLQKAETLKATLPVDNVRAIGVMLKPKLVFHSEPVSRLAPEAFHQCGEAIQKTIRVLGAVLTGNVSTKELGGPLMIGSVVAQAYAAGFFTFLNTVAFVSINLGVFNLLPLPVLDGGQIALNLIEAVRRKPLSMKFQERFQFAGLVFIVGLMLYVTWNDIVRWITNQIS